MSVFRTIVAQAGYTMTETEPDSDMLAIDASVDFPENPVPVQIKCSSTKSFRANGDLSFPITQAWKSKWDRNNFTPYMVLVMVPDATTDWLEHTVLDSPDGRLWGTTVAKAPAYWVPLKPLGQEMHVTFHKCQRFTADSIHAWYQSLLSELM